MYASTTGVDLVKLVSQGMEQSGYSSKKKKSTTIPAGCLINRK